MRLRKKIVAGLLAGFVIIQFFRPSQNTSVDVKAADFRMIYQVPDSINSVLQSACYDCHSNNTRYPWYSNIQPVGWMMAKHIKDGKEKLNFSEFGSYGSRRQISKLKGIASQVKDEEMPLTSYKMMHGNARLTAKQKILIISWMTAKADSISKNN